MIRTTRCRMNEKTAEGKKIKTCNNEPIQIKEKGNNLEYLLIFLYSYIKFLFSHILTVYSYLLLLHNKSILHK